MRQSYSCDFFADRIGVGARSALVLNTGLEEVAPTLLVDRNTELAGSGGNAIPRVIAIQVRHAFDLVEPSNGIADMVGIDQGFFPLFRKGEIVCREPVDRHRGRRRDVRLLLAHRLTSRALSMLRGAALFCRSVDTFHLSIGS